MLICLLFSSASSGVQATATLLRARLTTPSTPFSSVMLVLRSGHKYASVSSHSTSTIFTEFKFVRKSKVQKLNLENRKLKLFKKRHFKSSWVDLRSEQREKKWNQFSPDRIFNFHASLNLTEKDNQEKHNIQLSFFFLFRNSSVRLDFQARFLFTNLPSDACNLVSELLNSPSAWIRMSRRYSTSALRIASELSVGSAVMYTRRLVFFHVGTRRIRDARSKLIPPSWRIHQTSIWPKFL